MNLHARLMQVANDEINNHVELYDGEPAFNLFTYIDDLTIIVGNELEQISVELAGFRLEHEEIARYLWTCLCLQEHTAVYGAKFRKMLVMD